MKNNLSQNGISFQKVNEENEGLVTTDEETNTEKYDTKKIKKYDDVYQKTDDEEDFENNEEEEAGTTTNENGSVSVMEESENEKKNKKKKKDINDIKSYIYNNIRILEMSFSSNKEENISWHCPHKSRSRRNGYSALL